MILLRNMTLKNLALTAIAFLSAMMSVFAFSFGVAGNVLEKPVNAINWLFKSASFRAWEISGLGTFLIAFSFGIAIGSLVLFAAAFLLSPTKSKYVRGTRFVTLAALAATMILMIGGFIVSSAYNEMFFGSYLHELDVYVAQTFIPFVINTLLCIAYFGANMMLSD